VTYIGRVTVTLKRTVMDPQGSAVKSGLASMGYAGVREVRVGKYLEISLEAPTAQEAASRIDEMCRRLLANPVIEEYSFEVEEAEADSDGRPPEVGEP